MSTLGVQNGIQCTTDTIVFSETKGHKNLPAYLANPSMTLCAVILATIVAIVVAARGTVEI